MKGLCSVCKEYRWLVGKGTPCKPCACPMGMCVKCKFERKIYFDGLCDLCNQDRLVRKKLSGLEKLSTTNQYSHFLFDLYLTYIRRYNLRYRQLQQAKKLRSILENDPPETFKSWLQVYQYDEKYPLPYEPNTKKGHAILKIGYVLQELGVLPPREEELGRQLKNLFVQFSRKEQQWLAAWIESLTIRQREQKTVRHLLTRLRNFKLWLEPQDLLSVNQQTIEDYIQALREQNKKPFFIRTTFSALNQTYRFLKFQKLILVNPCKKIKLGDPIIKLCVASEKQTEALIRFIKTDNSNPELAMILSLVLFFGLTPIQLAQAQCLCQNDALHIILRQKPTSYAKRFYNREQSLILPQKPHWFLKLQKNFLCQWHQHYAKIKKTYPHKPLLLPHHHRHNRPLNTQAIRTRIKKATITATGQYIQPRILRQTCGHLYAKDGDASILSRLGWSPQWAFRYTWAPRTYHSPKV